MLIATKKVATKFYQNTQSLYARLFGTTSLIKTPRSASASEVFLPPKMRMPSPFLQPFMTILRAVLDSGVESEEFEVLERRFELQDGFVHSTIYGSVSLVQPRPRCIFYRLVTAAMTLRSAVDNQLALPPVAIYSYNLAVRQIINRTGWNSPAPFFKH